MGENDVRGKIEEEASRIEEDATHSAKGHFEAASRWGRTHFWIGVPATISSAVAAVSLLKPCPTLTAAFAIGAAVLTALVTFLKPEAKASAHLASGNRYLSLQSRARVFRNITLAAADAPSKLAEKVTELTEERNKLNETSPQVPRWAFERARKGIKAGEATHAVDAAKKSSKKRPTAGS